jgi:uncharacterized repeat protein (TIGR03803 family)
MSNGEAWLFVLASDFVRNQTKGAFMKKFILALVVLAMAAAIALPAEAQTFKALHQFDTEVSGEGAIPHGALLRDAAGNLYGTTLAGGSGDGTVFKIDSTGKETILLTFNRPVSGSSPDTPLIQDQAGNLYGIVQDGGPRDGGLVYKLSLQNELTILHAFQRGAKSNPVVPTGGLFMDKSGNLFGTTLSGGPADCQAIVCGTVFQLDPAGKVRLLHKFTGGSDGSEPFGPLVQDAAGNLYGVAHAGGDLSCPDPEIAGIGCGTVFKLARNGKFTVLHTFKGGHDGSVPQAGLIMDAAGDLYGVTSVGGNHEFGTAFKISKDGTYTILHRFARKDGTSPNGGLVLDEAGNLYGTAAFNSGHNLGSVFKLRPDGVLTVLYRFKGVSDGGVPSAGLIRDADGHLYGTDTLDVSNRRIQGTAFEITP